MNDVAAATMEVTSEAEKQAGYRQTYHELSARHVVEMDVLEQLKQNIAQLEDLHARMKFMMGEIGYLLKKN